jgi:hypothetical protein
MEPVQETTVKAKRPQPGTDEYKVYARERAGVYHDKMRAIRDLTRQYAISPTELAQYCGLESDTLFRPWTGPQIKAAFEKARAEGKVTQTALPDEEWMVKRGGSRKEGEATPKPPRKKADGGTKKGVATAATGSTKTEGKATPKTGKGKGKKGQGKADTAVLPGNLVGADGEPLELETVVVPDEEVYGPEGAPVPAAQNGTDPEQVKALTDWFGSQKPGSERMKLADAFYLLADTPSTQRAAAERAQVDLKSNFSGRCAELAKAGVIEEIGAGENGSKTWQMTDPALEAYEIAFPDRVPGEGVVAGE